MVALPSLKEQLQLKKVSAAAEELRRKQLAANKQKAMMLLLAVSGSESYVTKKVSDR